MNSVTIVLDENASVQVSMFSKKNLTKRCYSEKERKHFSSNFLRFFSVNSSERNRKMCRSNHNQNEKKFNSSKSFISPRKKTKLNKCGV